jgi:hypothetical protein
MGHSSGQKSAPVRDQVPLDPKGELFEWRTFDPAMLPGGLDAPLAAELVTYRDRLEEMLRDHEGEFVVMKGDRIVGYYPSRQAALKSAFKTFGRETVLVKRVVEFEPVRRVGGAFG